MASSCEINFNWYSDNTRNVTRYNFIDVESSDFEAISYENRVNSQGDSPLQFFKQDNADNFILTIVCNSPENSQINGISIDSESRTLEISNDVEGYIRTVRGRRLVFDSNKEDSSIHPNFYVCSCSFEKPYAALSIKFLSLGEKKDLSIRSIGINLQQHGLESKASRLNGTFDMAKLKKDIEGMGDSVSDKALDFLATMEVFEQNKINSMGSFLGQNALKSAQSKADHGFASNGIGLFPGITSIMQSVLGEETMKHLKESVPQNGEEDLTQNDSIYNMLQSVCGKVAKTRHSARPNEDTPLEDATVDQKQAAAEERLMSNVPDNSSVILEIVNKKLEEAKQDMTLEIRKVKKEVMNEMEGMKREITEKLDNITILLQALTNSQNSHIVEDK